MFQHHSLAHALHALRREQRTIRHVLDRLYWLLFPTMVLGAWAFGSLVATAIQTLMNASGKLPPHPPI